LNTRDGDLFDELPDLSDWKEVERWIAGRLAALEKSSFADDVRATFTGMEFAPSSPAMLGGFSSSRWRKLMLAAFAADWACYAGQADRVDFARLAHAIATFPAGFRVWFCRMEDGRHTPVGYSGWFPISAGVFSLLLERPETVSHRGLMTPLPRLDEPAYLYLFNASIVPQLRGASPQSALLMRRFADDIGGVRKKGLLSLTVSEDGRRFSRRFGMTQKGSIIVDGETEDIFVRADTRPWF
jgi:hypothetical protein